MPDSPDHRTTTVRRGAKPAEEKLYDDELGVGAIVGNYVIEAVRARGGFATLYKAKHMTLGRLVALKVLHRDLIGSSQMLQRFKQEGQSVNLIRHPNIVDIYEFGELSDRRPYLVMEWLEGRDLYEELKERGPLTLSEAIAVMEEVCAAVATAHRAGIVHRDLKASNVIAIPSGSWFSIKVVDFGIAKLLDDNRPGRLDLTTSSTRLGTPWTMAPEQILGGTIDARTDIYALGVFLFQILTGQYPFRADTPSEVEDLQLHAPPPRASDLAPLPASIDAIIQRCLQKNPQDRFASADELIGALRRLGAEKVVQDNVTTGPAIGLCLRIQVAGHEDDLPDSVLDEIDSLIDRARQVCLAAGLTVAVEDAKNVLGVAVLPQDSAKAHALKLRVLEHAARLGAELDQSPTPHPRISVIGAVHVDAITFCLEAGQEPRVMGGPLMTMGKQDHAKLGTMTVSQAAAADLADELLRLGFVRL